MARIINATETITRPANTTQYGTDEEWANSATAPTDLLFEELAGLSGKITDVVIVSSNDPATLLQGELWFFEDATTLVNDNAAWALSDADALKCIGPGLAFTMNTTVAGSGTNSIAHVLDYNCGFDLTTKDGLYMRVKVKNAYTPASGEVLTVRLKVEIARG